MLRAAEGIRDVVDEVEEAVGAVAVVAGEGEQAELAVQEDDGVTGAEEVLGGSGAASPGGEVVDEADGLVFEGNGGAPGGDEDDPAGWGDREVVGDESAGEGYVGVEGWWGRVAIEVVGRWVRVV